MAAARIVEGTVVWAHVPFEDDPTQGKDRPVLVLVVGRSEETAVLGLPFYSHRRDQTGWIEIGTGSWDDQRRCSYARADRIRSIPRCDIRRVCEPLPQDRFAAIFLEVDRCTRPPGSVPRREQQSDRPRYEPGSPKPAEHAKPRAPEWSPPTTPPRPIHWPSPTPPPRRPLPPWPAPHPGPFPTPPSRVPLAGRRVGTAVLSAFSTVVAMFALIGGTAALGSGHVLSANAAEIVMLKVTLFGVVGLVTMPAAWLAVHLAIAHPHHERRWMRVWRLLCVLSLVLGFSAVAMLLATADVITNPPP